ncbi:MAG: ABC transporter permease [Saprospiraceae bacterium]
MKQLFAFIRKEFAHVLRDKKTLLILLGMPIAQILIFGFALSNEVKNARLIIWDQSQNAESRQLIHKIGNSKNFELVKYFHSEAELENVFKSNQAKIALIIGPGFDALAAPDRKQSMQIIADASDPNIAQTLNLYLRANIGQFQQENSPQLKPHFQITTEMRMLYNPQLKSAHNFVPGVMALIMMLVCVMMTAISIVREKESGTMEILLVSPLQPFMIVIAKTIPYLIISLVNITSILLLSVFLMDLPILGNIVLLYAECTLFIIACLSIGILISIKTESQQSAMLISLMGMMLPTLLFSGFMFPIENMPIPLQYISDVVPSKWFYIIVKSIMIKGLGFADIWKETCILFGTACFFILVSLKQFKIRLQ